MDQRLVKLLLFPAHPHHHPVGEVVVFVNEQVDRIPGDIGGIDQGLDGIQSIVGVCRYFFVQIISVVGREPFDTGVDMVVQRPFYVIRAARRIDA